MGIMDKLKDNEKLDKLSKKTFHSKYYHKRYEGYVENYATDARGRRYIKRTYIAEYYSPDLSDKRRILIRVLYAFLYLLSVGCFIFVSGRSVESNFVIFIQIICFLLVIAMLMMMVFLISYIFSPKKMTIWEHYAGPTRVKAVSAAIAVLLAIQALSVVIFVILRSDVVILDELVTVVGYLAASVSMFLINRIENKVRYSVIPNENRQVKGGYYIDS